MGDRTTTYLPCPKCGKESEQYDAPSSLIWSWKCNHCGWTDGCNYYEISPTEIVCCTREAALKNGGLVICPKCKREVMGSYLEKDGCLECNSLPTEDKE